MEVSEHDLKVLASHIITNLKCDCGCKFGDHYKEPCACGWTHIEEWFQDDYDIDFKLYEEDLKQWYKEEYNFDIKFKGE